MSTLQTVLRRRHDVTGRTAPADENVVDAVHVAGGSHDGRHVLVAEVNAARDLRIRAFYVNSSALLKR